MTERSYTVKEIDALRGCCWSRFRTPFGYAGLRGDGSYRGPRGHEDRAAIEEMVRTHMLAGHTAEDLIASEKPE